MRTRPREIEQYLQWAADMFAAVARGDELPGVFWYDRSNGLRRGNADVEGLTSCSVAMIEARPDMIALQHSFDGHFPRGWLGSLSIIQKWPDVLEHQTHASFATGPLAGREVFIYQARTIALEPIGAPTHTSVWVFTPGYPDHDPNFRKFVMRPPLTYLLHGDEN